jgi:hypothetical protein
MLSCRHFEIKVVEQYKGNFVHPLTFKNRASYI